jgi:DNA-binding NarL/FixJ family response regulator
MYSLEFAKPDYEVVFAADAESAMKELEASRAEPFPVGVFDLRIPERFGTEERQSTGLELLEKTRRLFPQIEIIAYTAYGIDATIATRLKQLGVARTFESPFSLKDLHLAVDKALQAR